MDNFGCDVNFLSALEQSESVLQPSSRLSTLVFINMAAGETLINMHVSSYRLHFLSLIHSLLKHC